MLEDVQIAAADSAGQHFGEHLSWAGRGIGKVIDPKLPVSHDGRAHGPTVVRVVPLRAPWIGGRLSG